MPEYVRPAPPTGWKRVVAALFPPLYWYSWLWDEFAPGAFLVTFGLYLAMIWLFKAAMALLP
jgi:hypothetical protein